MVLVCKTDVVPLEAKIIPHPEMDEELQYSVDGQVYTDTVKGWALKHDKEWMKKGMFINENQGVSECTPEDFQRDAEINRAIYVRDAISTIASFASFAIVAFLVWKGIRSVYPSLHAAIVVVIAGCLASLCMLSWSLVAVAIGFGVV